MVKVLYYSTLILLTLGQLTALSKAEGNNLYLFDAAVAGSAIVFCIFLLTIAKKFVVPKSYLFLFLFLAIGIISLYVNSWRFTNDEIISAFFYALRLGFYMLFGLCIYNLILIKKFTTNEILNSIVISGVVVAILGYIQLLILPDFEQLNPQLGWDPHKNRLASTFFDPNFTGAYLVLTLSIYILSLFKKLNLNSLLIVGILLLGIILTFSRSTWLMLALTIFLYGILKNPKILLISLIVAFLAYYSTPRIQTRISGTTDPADSAYFRYISWGNTLKIIEDNSLIGVGYNTLRPIQIEYGFEDPDTYLKHSASGSDSSLLFVGATTGLIGLMMFIFGLLHPIVIKNNLQKSRYIILIIPLLIESIFINSLFYPQILVVWLILLSMNYLVD